MCSRGSVIPLFISQIKNGHPITITDPAMTRFMMSLDDAVNLVLFAFKHGQPGEIFVHKAPAATIEVLANALSNILEIKNYPINVIGTRHGEKLFEVLLSREEMFTAKELDGYYCIPPDLRDLNYVKYVEKGEKKLSNAEEYNSHNTTRLDIAGMQKLLIKLGLKQNILLGQQVEAED
jgi:UDP-glucose 4-epimerase